MAARGKYGAGTTYQRPDGTWAAQWSAGKDEYGRRIRGTTAGHPTEAAAQKAMAAMRGRSSSTRRKRGGESVGAFLERWLEEAVKPTKRERTYWGYRSIVAHHLTPAFGNIALVSLSRRDVQAWVNRQDCAPLTTRHRLDCLRAAMSRAVRWGLIDTNPAKEIDLPAVPRRTVRAMSPDDARAVLAAVEGTWFAPLVTVALYTGLRQGELLGLRWEDVNLGNSHGRTDRDHAGRRPDVAGAAQRLHADAEHGRGPEGVRGLGAVRDPEAPLDADGDFRGLSVGAVLGDARGTGRGVRADAGAGGEGAGASLTVHHSLARLPGRHGIRYVLDAPKSARSRRTVPLAPPAVAALREARKAALDGAANPHGLVFARPDGRPIDGTALTHEFQAALGRADLPRMTWHQLRHAWVSLLLDSGVPLVEVSQMAGHSGVGITADVYGHLTNERRAEAIEKMAARIG